MGSCCKPTSITNLDYVEYPATVSLKIKERDKKGFNKGISYIKLALSTPRDQVDSIMDLGPYKIHAYTSIIPGQDPHCEYKKECQDSSGFTSSNNIFFGVLFDGHGKEGHKVSQFCKDFMLDFFIQNTEKFENSPEGTIEELVLRTDKELINSGINCKFSGTTAVVVVLTPDSLFIGSLGDSRGILATLPRDGNESNATSASSSYRNFKVSRVLKPVPLTVDQKPNHEEELKRIRKAGGIVERVTNDKGVPFGPYRVWRKKGNGPGLAMSRSIGDTIAHEIGVISVPVITKFGFYPSQDQFIIIASDGIWDTMDNLDAVNFVEKFRSTSSSPTDLYPATISNSSISRLLCEEARTRWLKIVEEEDVMIDDISCIIIELSSVEPGFPCEVQKIAERTLESRHSLTVEGYIKNTGLDPARKDIVRGSIIEVSDEELEN